MIDDPARIFGMSPDVLAEWNAVLDSPRFQVEYGAILADPNLTVRERFARGQALYATVAKELGYNSPPVEREADR